MDFGKSLCVLCRQPLAQGTPVAAPSNCPTHFFHFNCLVQHATQDRRCPIDQVPFDNIVLGDGAPGDPAPEQDEEKIKAENEGEKEEDGEDGQQGAASSKNQVNINELPPLARMKISREEDDESKKKTSQSAGQKITNEPTRRGGLDSNDSGIVECMICKRTKPGEKASPDCCTHWFHRDCLEDYLGRNSVCPVRGCHREVTTYVCSFGQSRGIEMTVECEYRNMASAPDGFECEICHLAEIGRHRAVAKPCGHILHRHCLTEFVRNHKKCPICLTPTTLVVCDTSGNLYFD